MTFRTFIRYYGTYHYDSTETSFELDDGQIITIRPCTQLSGGPDFYLDYFRNVTLSMREDYLGIFDQKDRLIGYITETGNLVTYLQYEEIFNSNLYIRED